jgi:hypothetical protein
MSSITSATTPAPEDEITLAWLLENPVTRSRTICSLAGIIADFNDLDATAPETADPDTRDLWFLANQAWRAIDRSEVELAFRDLRHRTEHRRTRRDTNCHPPTPSPRGRTSHSELRARTPITGS